MLENKVNQTSFKATRAKLAEHPIEQVGAKLRDDDAVDQAAGAGGPEPELMHGLLAGWARGCSPYGIKQRALVDLSRN